MNKQETENIDDRHNNSKGKKSLSLSIELFQGLSAVEQARLLGSMEKIELPAGAILFDHGDDGDSMYIVINGNIELFTVAEDNRKHLLAVLGSGEAFGEMSLLTGEPRTASALALNDTLLYRIDVETFAAMIAENNSISEYFIRLLSRRLTQTNDRLKKAQADNTRLVLDNLEKLSGPVRQVIMASSLLPFCPKEFLAEYFKVDQPDVWLKNILQVCPNLIRGDEDAAGFTINPVTRKVLAEIFLREAGEQREELIAAALEYFLSREQLVPALQILAMNGCWKKVCDLVNQYDEVIAEQEMARNQIASLLEDCPEEILFTDYDVFTLFINSYLAYKPHTGLSKLQSALMNQPVYFSPEQAARLYEYAADYCKKLGLTQKGLEYLNMALSLTSYCDNQKTEAGSSGAMTGNQDRDYHLAKQQLNSAGRIAMAKKASQVFSRRSGIAALASTLLALLSIGYFSQTEIIPGLSREAMLFLGISLAAVAFWIVNLVPPYLVALVMAMSWVLADLVKPEDALSGFASPIWLFMLCILALGAAIAKSGLLYRLSLYALKVFPLNYQGQLLGLMASGLLVGPLIPSSTVKVGLASPIAQGIAKAMGFADRSKGSAGLGLAAMVFYGYSAPFTLTGTYCNILGLGLTPAAHEITWLKWLLYALPALAVYAGGMLLYISSCFKAETGTRSLSLQTLDEQLNILGALTRDEKLTIAVAAGAVLLLILQPFHQVGSTWIMLSGFAVLVLGGVLDNNSLKNSIDWPFLLFIGVAFSFTAVASSLGVVQVLTDVLCYYMNPFMSSPYLFLAAVALTAFLLTFIVRGDPALILLVVTMIPLAERMGIHAWVLVFVIILTSDPFFFSYQSPTYLTSYYSTEGKSFSHRQGQQTALVYALLVLTAIFLSIPYWKALGLII